VQLKQDLALVHFTEACTWARVCLYLLILEAYSSGRIPTPPYPDRIFQKIKTWDALTKQYKMPEIQRRVVLDGIRHGSKLGFELEPGSVDLSEHTWKDPLAFIAACKGTIKAIEYGVLNVSPADVRRLNKYFIIDKKPDPDAPNIPLYREIFHASSDDPPTDDLHATIPHFSHCIACINQSYHRRRPKSH
jgi:hypothetical protein